MAIPLKDKSSYLRGLLILARKDGSISECDRKIITGAAKKLGFSSDFCEEILNSLLENEFIENEPVNFLSHTVAQSFISDGLKLVCSNNVLRGEVIEWLRQIAKLNHISSKWFDNELNHCKLYVKNIIPTQLTLYSII